MANSKSQSFVSVISVLEAGDNIGLGIVGKIQQELSNYYTDYEIVLVVQKNAQATVKNTIGTLLASVPCIRYLQLSNTVSRDVAWSAGLENAIGDFLVLFDLKKDPPHLIHQGVETCKSGNDVVIGIAREEQSLGYMAFRPFAQLLLNLAEYTLPKNATTFRCLSRRAANAVMETGHFHQQFFMRIQKTGYEFAQIDYILQNNDKKSFKKGFFELLNLTIFNSTAPLRLMSTLGLAGSGVACLFVLYTLIVNLLKNNVVEGWTTIMLMLSVFAFLQFTILAFISEYINRLLNEQSPYSSYSIVFEKNSFVMVDEDRINVFEESTDKEKNRVQTGRDR